MIALYTLTVVWAFIEAMIDGAKIYDNDSINHTGSFWLRTVIIGVCCFMAMGGGILLPLAALFSCGILFWISFDYILNILLNRPPFKRGITSWTDQILHLFPNEKQAFYFKVGIFVLSIILILLI